MGRSQGSKKTAKKKRQAKRQKRLIQSGSPLLKSLVAPPNDIDICLCPSVNSFNEVGIGSVVILSSPGGSKHRMTSFLIDAKCFGVKDAFQRTVRIDQVQSILATLNANEDLERCKPEFARKFIEEALEYGRSVGFEPGGAFTQAFKIFSSVLETCEGATNFRFGGPDGKPVYVAGPNDSKAFQRNVIQILEKSCGSGNYNFVLGVGGEVIGW